MFQQQGLYFILRQEFENYFFAYFNSVYQQVILYEDA